MKTLKEYIGESFVDDALNDTKAKRKVYKNMAWIKSFIDENINDILDEWGWGDAYTKCITHMREFYPGIIYNKTNSTALINTVLPKWFKEWLITNKYTDK